MTTLAHHAMGTAVTRLDGPAKVTGAAPYAFEFDVENPVYLHPVQATIAHGHVTAMDTAAAQAVDGVAAVLTVFDAPTLADTSNGDLAVPAGHRCALPRPAHRRRDRRQRRNRPGSSVSGARRVRRANHRCRADRRSPEALHPEQVNPDYAAVTSQGDVEAALREAAVVIDNTYTTPHEHNSPMEPHACIALWDNDELTMWDSTQGVHAARKEIATAFGLDPEKVRVIAKNVGGGFGSKGAPAFTQCAGRDGRPTTSGPAREAGADPPADVRHGRLPHPDHPASAPRSAARTGA